MPIQVNPDHNIEGREARTAHHRTVVERAHRHGSAPIIRGENHVAEECGPKSGSGNVRCAMDTRRERHPPLAVPCEAATVRQGVDGATERLIRPVAHALSRRREEQKRRTDPSRAEAEVPMRP